MIGLRSKRPTGWVPNPSEVRAPTARCLTLCLWLVFVASAEGAPLILAPERSELESEQSQQSLRRVIRGIQQIAPGADVIQTSPEILVDELNQWHVFDGAVNAQREVIVLTEPLIETYRALNRDNPWIGGGYADTLSRGVDFHALSPSVSPYVVFAELLKLNPRLKTVYTSVLENHFTHYLDEVTRAANQFGLQIIVHTVTDERTTARAWFAIANSLDPGREAIWVMDSSYMDNTGSFRYVNEFAWQNKLLVVSTVPAYAQRGVALGWQIDWDVYGQLLITTLRERRAQHLDRTELYLPSTAMKRVLNRRTLSNLNLTLPRDVNTANRRDVVIP